MYCCAVQCCIPFSHSLINKSKSMKLLLLLFLYLISYSFFTEANSCVDDIPEYQDEDNTITIKYVAKDQPIHFECNTCKEQPFLRYHITKFSLRKNLIYRQITLRIMEIRVPLFFPTDSHP